MNHVSDSVTFSRDLSLDLFKHILYVSPHPPCVDTGAVAEKRPDDGDDALLCRQVESCPPVPHHAVHTGLVARVVQQDLDGSQVVLHGGHMDGRQSQVLIVLVSSGSGSDQQTNWKS